MPFDHDFDSELIYQMPSTECTVPLKWRAAFKELIILAVAQNYKQVVSFIMRIMNNNYEYKYNIIIEKRHITDII